MLANNHSVSKSVTRVFLFEKSNGRDLPEDFHSKYHTHLLCHRGQVIFSIDDTKHCCQSGEFVFWLAKNSLIKDFYFSEDLEATILLVERDFMTNNVPDQNWGIDAVLNSHKYPVKQLDHKNDQNRILTNFQRLYHHYQNQTHLFYEEALKLQLRLFILEMWNIFANEYERRSRTIQSGTLYEKFIHLIENEHTTQREVQFYSQKLHVSPKHLNYISKQNSDITASGWIQRYTKDHIRILLQNKNLSISEIANEMNFSSRSFFTRYVKKVLGVTPSEYRNRLG